MTEVGRLIDLYADSQEYRPADAAMARRIGVSKSAFGKWRHAQAFPKPHHVRALATLLGIPHRTLLTAFLVDAGYLPKEREGSGQQPAPTSGPGAVAVTPTPDELKRARKAASQRQPRTPRGSSQD